MRYQVQFTLPCDPPIVKKSVNKRGPNDEHPSYCFEVPINHPSAHNMGFQELLNAAEAGKLSTVSTRLNKTGGSVLKEISNKITRQGCC